MNADTLLENFEILAEAPGGIDQLREVILGLAAQGKLFRDTDLTKWQLDVTLKDFGRMIRGVTYAKAESSKEPIPNFVPLLGAANIQRSINYEGLTFVASSLIKPDQYLKDGDVLICMSSGSKHLVGKAGIVRNPPTSSFGAFCGVFRISDEKNRDYLAMLFKSPIYRNAISVASRGIGINNLRVGDIESIAFSLPPLAEQKRIVAKVDELMALCDQLEQQQKQRDNRCAAARESAISELVTAKTSEEILKSWKRISENWSVMASDGESLVKIEETVLKLAASGRFDRNAQDISSETDLPGTWKLKKFGELVEFSMGKTPPTKDATYWGGANSTMWISISDMVDGGEVLTSQRSVSLRARRESFRRDPWPVGTLLMSFKLTIGKVSRLGAPGYFNEAIIAFKSDSKELDEYLFRVLPILAAAGDSKGAVKGSTLNSKSISELQIPLPPEDELERVTTQIDELINLCRGLLAELERRDLLATQFARSAGKS